ncbi:inositol polyphosphate 5-phosphatase [Lecanosticta acicola]|uniref:Inositol polyphosphate 5-phosphatase n=1 Tax=Lecanosticta acicola TaxID=111012 RepID=A0AAI8YZ32_9PEZI|nr:inositol polyphosphate 5-phosphatase [Lecanosticta acicola]
MAESADGPDTSSIKPISSLRSRFENLGKDQNAGQPTSPAPQQASLTTPSPVGGGWSRISGEHKRDPGGMGVGPVGGNAAQVSPLSLSPRQPRPDPPAARPASMISMSPTQPSPPMVTVDSPRSPQKIFSMDLRPTASGYSTPSQPLTPNRTSDTLNKVYSRPVSRTATPAIEARAAAFLQSSGSPSIKSHDVADVKAETESKAKPEAKHPPIVNRAAKPKVPVKPQALAKAETNLSAPETNAELTDQSISPFTTPPSSGDSSPDPRKQHATATSQPIKKASEASFVQRSRNDSDASWVTRLGGDSDSFSIARRARAESDASFVESSSLPETWLPPPTHHAGAARRELNARGITRAPTMPMPARYRQVGTRESQSTDDLQEDRPRLPARPELQIRNGRTSPPKMRSGRTSPLKNHMLPGRRSEDVMRKGPAADMDTTRRIPAIKTDVKSALSQGFEKASPMTPSGAPAVPPPRKSVDRRREMPPPPPPPGTATSSIQKGHSRDDEEDLAPGGLNSEQVAGPTDFPDATQSNRRQPRFRSRPWTIYTEYDTRLFGVCGEYVCTSGYITKAWNIRTGEELLHMEPRENMKVTALVFKPSPNVEDEGKRLWLGTSSGDIQEIDIPSQSLVKTKSMVHNRREIIRMFRYASELWTLDDGGELYVWKADHKGIPSLDSQYMNWRIPKGISYSIASGAQLWIATGKEIRVYLPGANSDSEFQASRTPLSQPGTGDVTCGATLNGNPNLIYFGHSDGKVSIYNRTDYTCRAIVNVSVYRISSMTGVGDYIWAGYSTGNAYVYDTSTTPWTVKKDWKAHEKQICSIIADPSAMWKMNRLNVVTLGLDNSLRIWDGMLEGDWIESRMNARISDYCSFQELTASVLTWNAGASKPSYLNQSKEDSNFFSEYMTNGEPPDIFVFGFQELVDLEDKKVTAKSFFKSKKKDPAEQEHMSRQYRAWRDYLTKCIDDCMPNTQTYTHLHTSSMVGLFTCTFVKSHLRQRVRHVHTAQVKRGMGGHHGNKGALLLRLVLDDSSMCFVNCHLAAGQTQTMHRNNDIAAILEANPLPPNPLNDGEVAQHSDVFAHGGDGSMIMDHEICILNGDLNYRIDTMGRDAVIKQVQQGNLTKLLERDQLLLSRKKNPGFRLKAFQESPITFAPTYKYNVGSDEYDTSEKRRAPAWCDRILYRGLGKVKMDGYSYQRWDQIRVSDHRPVSGRLRLRVKTVDGDKREITWDKCVKEFEGVSQRIAKAAQLEYLTNVLGMAPKEAERALQGN